MPVPRLPLLCHHPQHGSWALPTPPGLPQGHRAKEGEAWEAWLCSYFRERFHLPNPSPTICPQKGTKGLLTAQISLSSCTAPGERGIWSHWYCEKTQPGANTCMWVLEDWKVVDCLQVPKRAGRPGMGVVPDSEGQDQATLPRALLLSAARDTRHLYPFCCQIERVRAWRKTTLILNPSSQTSGTGEGLCVCVTVCARWSVCVFSRSMCPYAPAPRLSTLGCLFPVGLCLLGIRQDV